MARDTPVPKSGTARAYLEHLPEWTVGIDPGESCGLAFHSARRPIRTGDSFADHIVAVTLGPEDAQDRVADWIMRAHNAGGQPRLVIEEYRIYPGKEMVHSGQRCLTSEYIGGFLYLARRLKATVVQQPASIKEPTAAMMRSRGILLTGKTQHAKDAEFHLWHPLLKQIPNYRKLKETST